MRRLHLTLILIVCLTGSVLAQSKTLEVVKSQVAAFNAQDIEALVSNISEDFKWYGVADDAMSVEVDGPKEFQISMLDYFKEYPSAKAVIEDPCVVGDQVSFREKVSWTTKSGETKSQMALGVYQVVDGKIRRVWYFYGQSE